jgi:predicted metal-dependent hydrolase
MRDQLGPLLKHHQHSMSVQSRAVRIKRMQTRWGSCGGKNDINLNWLLSFAPAAVLEYVLVHELCHIRHRDHSPSFWAMVREHCPGYAGERAWLKEHGAGLIARFGEIR